MGTLTLTPMPDELVSGLLKDTDLRVVLVTTGELSRQARATHHAEPAAAALFSQALSAAAMMAALQKSGSRVNLQLECDGPLRGLFVDGDASGVVRGYVKNPLVGHVGGAGEYHWRPVLGNRGFISVLREQPDGEYYRSSVELKDFDFVRDLEHYFATSDQVQTQVHLAQLPTAAQDGAEEPLGHVVGLLMQPLPDGDREAFEAHRKRLQGQFEGTVRVHAAAGASALLKALFPQPDLEVMSRYALSYACGCSKERVKRALLAMGREELGELLEKEGKAEATCHFCTTRYVIPGDEIREMLASGSV